MSMLLNINQNQYFNSDLDISVKFEVDYSDDGEQKGGVRNVTVGLFRGQTVRRMWKLEALQIQHESGANRTVHLHASVFLIIENI